MTREGGRCGGRGINIDNMFVRKESTRIAQLEERLAKRMDYWMDRLELSMEQIGRCLDALVAASPNLHRKSSPNLHFDYGYVSYGIYNSRTYYNPRREERDYHVPSYNVSKPIDYGCDKDKDNDLNEIDNLSTDYSTRKGKKDNEIPNFYQVKEGGKEDINEFKIGESFIDLSAPAIYDDYDDDVFIYKKEKDDETEIGHENFGEQNPCRKINFNSLPKSNNFNESINSSKVEIRKYQFNDFERYDFLGIEQILLKSYTKESLNFYLLGGLRNFQIENSVELWSAKVRKFKYSKYLFEWSGRLQYLLDMHNSNSRPNFVQPGENDAARYLRVKGKLVASNLVDPSVFQKGDGGPLIKINQGLI